MFGIGFVQIIGYCESEYDLYGGFCPVYDDDFQIVDYNLAFGIMNFTNHNEVWKELNMTEERFIELFSWFEYKQDLILSILVGLVTQTFWGFEDVEIITTKLLISEPPCVHVSQLLDWRVNMIKKSFNDLLSLPLDKQIEGIWVILVRCLESFRTKGVKKMADDRNKVNEDF